MAASFTIAELKTVIPAQAGIPTERPFILGSDSRLRGKSFLPVAGMTVYKIKVSV
jgi:hypothetical protein